MSCNSGPHFPEGIDEAEAMRRLEQTLIGVNLADEDDETVPQVPGAEAEQ